MRIPTVPVGLSGAAVLALLARTASGWGGLGHVATAFVATEFVTNTTRHHLQALLADRTDDYLGSVATWADSVKYTKWGHFSRTFHFIDAHDQPPATCNVDLARDCKPSGCVVSALANYTEQLLGGGSGDGHGSGLLDWTSSSASSSASSSRRRSSKISDSDRAIAAKFVIHFVGDIHQPLHDEDAARGGNGIPVLWEGKRTNLHSVWDGSIVEKWIGERHGGSRKGRYARARAWGSHLAREIGDGGKFADLRDGWIEGLEVGDPTGTGLRWVRESNEYVCTTVLPEGADAIRNQELSGEYYEAAGPVVELQVARGGYRLAALLDATVREYLDRQDGDGGGEL